MRVVKMTPLEIHVGSSVGLARKVKSIKDGRGNAYGHNGLGWDYDCMGALAEMAFAKTYGVYWSPSVDTFKDADVGTNIQVRHTLGSNHSLLLRPRDKPDHLYVLVTDGPSEFVVRGWIRGEDGKKECWLRNPKRPPGYKELEPAYFVPQSALHEMPWKWSLDVHTPDE